MPSSIPLETEHDSQDTYTKPISGSVQRSTHIRQTHNGQEKLLRYAVPLIPALLYLGIRLLSTLVLAVMGSIHGVGLDELLKKWDAGWYLALAEHGYQGIPTTMLDGNGVHTAHTALAFFPGYPTLVGWLAKIPGLSLFGAALTVSLISGIVTAYGLVALGRQIRQGSTRVGLLLVALFAAAPMGVVFFMPYTEALFCALAVWALLFVLQRKWLWAGVLGSLAGLVRPTALALVIVVVIAAGIVLSQRREGWRPFVGLIIAPIGLLGYLLWVGFQVYPQGTLVDQVFAWSDLERSGWNTGFDGGVSTIKFLVDTVTIDNNVMNLGAVAVILSALTLFILSLIQRSEWPLLVYSAAVLVITLASSSALDSIKARFLMVAFPLLIPIAMGLAKRRNGTIVPTVSGIVLVSAWFGAHSLTIWESAI